MNKNFLGVFLSLAAAFAAMAGALAVLYKVMKKHLKFTVEVLPDEIENENEITAVFDAVDVEDIADEAEEAEEEIEISFVEEDEENA